MTPKLRIPMMSPMTQIEIMEDEYSDFWEKANKVVDNLKSLQVCLVEMFPLHKGLLPDSFDKLEKQDAQERLLFYLNLCTIYCIAQELFVKIDNCCENLISSNSDEDSEQKTLNDIDAISFDTFLNDHDNGFFKLDDIIQRFAPNDVRVLSVGSYTYRDIKGVINKGYQSEAVKNVWKSAINGSYPTSSNIGELLKENKIVRIG